MAFPSTNSAVPYVFLVDDDQGVLDANRFLLKSYGWKVQAFDSPGDCLAALRLGGTAPDCIVSDLQMPQMNGVELVLRLRAQDCEVPCVILTGNAGTAMTGQAIASGAAEVLDKPASFEQLAGAVLRAVRAQLCSPPATLLKPPHAWKDAGRPPPLDDGDFRALYAQEPTLDLVLAPDLTIVARSDAYARATGLADCDPVGRHLFDVFPDNPDDPAATGVRNLKASLQRALSRADTDRMVLQKYDVQDPQGSGHFVERWWHPVNLAARGKNGTVQYLVHRVKDMTRQVWMDGAGSAALGAA